MPSHSAIFLDPSSAMAVIICHQCDSFLSMSSSLSFGTVMITVPDLAGMFFDPGCFSIPLRNCLYSIQREMDTMARSPTRTSKLMPMSVGGRSVTSRHRAFKASPPYGYNALSSRNANFVAFTIFGISDKLSETVFWASLTGCGDSGHCLR